MRTSQEEFVCPSVRDKTRGNGPLASFRLVVDLETSTRASCHVNRSLAWLCQGKEITHPPISDKHAHEGRA